ncbi:hypothetical protein BJ165DRAFT_1516797 [Panaeolus papilionaceus]|nr:hypothetical protein BJ165DRAFT_1516797 [Panaeolus papilionaceus]
MNTNLGYVIGILASRLTRTSLSTTPFTPTSIISSAQDILRLFTVTLSMEIPELQYLKITGDVSVETVTTSIPQDPYPCVYLIMGPTGAGKSSFIEAFAGESQRLLISKNQLSGYTQAVTAYRLVNVVHTELDPPRSVYLVEYAWIF